MSYWRSPYRPSHSHGTRAPSIAFRQFRVVFLAEPRVEFPVSRRWCRFHAAAGRFFRATVFSAEKSRFYVSHSKMGKIRRFARVNPLWLITTVTVFLVSYPLCGNHQSLFRTKMSKNYSTVEIMHKFTMQNNFCHTPLVFHHSDQTSLIWRRIITSLTLKCIIAARDFT